MLEKEGELERGRLNAMRHGIRVSSVESFYITIDLVMRFFLGEIGLQKYYLAQ